MFPLFGFPWIKILTVFSNCPSPIQEMPPLVRQSSRVLFILNTEAWWPSVLAATGHYFCYELFMLVNFTNQITQIFRKYSDCSGILHVSLWGTIRPNVLLHIHSILRFAVQSLSGVQLFVAPRTAESQASLSFTRHGLQKPRLPCLLPSPEACSSWSIQSVIPSNHLILCRPLLLLPSIYLSIRVFFQWVSSSHQVAKVLEVQFQHQSFRWIFRVDFL